VKAISLTQPWASLVTIGAKRIETRSWWTSYRGPLAIHAAMRYPADAQDFTYSEIARKCLSPHFLMHSDIPLHKKLPRGFVIATCQLKACVRTEELILNAVYGADMTEQEKAFGDYSPGRWGWLLADVVRLPEPVRAKGALSLWEWNP